jgi:hypothetical protein
MPCLLLRVPGDHSFTFRFDWQLNALVEIPRERHARLRLRTELEIAGFHEIAEAIKLRAAHTTGESIEDITDLQPEDEALVLPGDEQGDGNSKSSRFLINRKLTDKEAGKAPAVGGRRTSTTPPGASTVTRDTAATIGKAIYSRIQFSHLFFTLRCASRRQWIETRSWLAERVAAPRPRLPWALRRQLGNPSEMSGFASSSWYVP